MTSIPGTESLLSELDQKQKLLLDGFGIFRLRRRKIGGRFKNPMTGDVSELALGESAKVIFTPGRALRAVARGRALPRLVPDTAFDGVVEAYDRDAFALDDLLKLLARRGRQKATPSPATRKGVAHSFLAHANPEAFRPHLDQTFRLGSLETILEDDGGNSWATVGTDELAYVDHEAAGDPAGMSQPHPACDVLAAFLLDHEVRAIVGDDGYYSAAIHWRVSELRSRLCEEADSFGELPY